MYPIGRDSPRPWQLFFFFFSLAVLLSSLLWIRWVSTSCLAPYPAWNDVFSTENKTLESGEIGSRKHGQSWVASFRFASLCWPAAIAQGAPCH